MIHSSSSSDSEELCDTPDDESSISAGEPSSGTVFRAFDIHSINGKNYFYTSFKCGFY